MPALIKIVINIKLVLIILLLHEVNGLRNRNNNKHIRRYQYSKTVPAISEDSIIMKWMNTEATLRKAYLNLLKSLLPTAYGLSRSSNLTSNCTYSLIEYMSGLLNGKTWAFKMFDTTGILQNGLFSGTPMAYGDYDACLDVEHPAKKFKGQYCYVELALPLPKRKLMTASEVPVKELQNLFEVDTIGNHLTSVAQYLYSSQLRSTVCVPSACSKEDVQKLASSAMSYFKLMSEVSVAHCEVKEDEDFTAMEIFIYAIFVILIGIVTTGTILDVILRTNPSYLAETTCESNTVKALVCFSLYTNYIKLIRPDNSPESLKIFHGLRVVSMCWIILSHSYLIINFNVFDGAFFSKTMRSDLFIQLINNGFLAVENFLFMSSVLISYVCVRMKGRISLLQLFFKRYMRLTPTMMLVAAMFAIVGRFGSGPLWKETVTNTLSKNCLERGWMNLFFVNNFLYSSKTCLGWTWYLSTDTQLFVIAMYIALTLRRKPGRGLLAAISVLILGVSATAFSHIYYKLPPSYLRQYQHFDDWYYYANKGYTQAHFHLSVCAVGLVVGYILATKKGHIPKHINVLGWILCPLLFLIYLCLSYHWNYSPENIPGMLVSALYGSLHRLLWALGLGFITLSCTWGQGGIVNSFLSWEGFVPLGRLTYLVYLIHYGFMYMFTGSVRQTMTLNHRSFGFICFNNMFVSFLGALVLNLFFESPFLSLERVFSDGKIRKQIQPLNVENGYGPVVKNKV